MNRFRLAILLLVLVVSQTRVWGAPLAPASVLLTEQEVRDAVNQAVQRKVAGRGWDVKLRKISLPTNIKLPAGPRELELVPPRQWDGWGAANMALMVRVDGRLERNIPLRIELEASADGVVAARQLAAGTVLAVDDVTIQRLDVGAAQGRFIVSIDEAVGKKLRTSLRQNAPLRSDQLDRVPVIKSGQLVTIVAESALVRITASGRARSSGAVGDIIMVQNQGSGREFPAKVLDASTVLVGF